MANFQNYWIERKTYIFTIEAQNMLFKIQEPTFTGSDKASSTAMRDISFPLAHRLRVFVIPHPPPHQDCRSEYSTKNTRAVENCINQTFIELHNNLKRQKMN